MDTSNDLGFLPPQRKRPWQSHRLGFVAGSDLVLQPMPPTSPATR